MLVTGGSGRIGNHVVGALCDRGHRVISYDRRKQSDARAEFVFGNVHEREQVQSVMKGCDVVCHLAEIPGPVSGVSEDEIYWSNAKAGSVVMQTGADLKIKRVIYTSTCQVYGTWGGPYIPPVRLPVDESHPIQPGNVYAFSKVANEGFARLTSHIHGLPISIFRLPMVIWHGNLHLFHSRMDSGPAPEMGTYVDATDAALAYVAAVESDRPGCEAYNIAAADVMSNIPIRARLLEHHPNYPALPESWPDFKAPILSEKAREHFGWEAKWDMRSGMIQK